jgi:hypothetical protein
MNQIRPAGEKVELKKKMSFDTETFIPKKLTDKMNRFASKKEDNCTSIDKESCNNGKLVNFFNFLMFFSPRYSKSFT